MTNPDATLRLTTHHQSGTLIHFTIPVHVLADLAESMTRADQEGRPLSVMLEIEPAMEHSATLKVKVGHDGWTRGLGQVSNLRRLRLFG